MSSLERLGANIRSLRKAYGETQEELGAALNVEKNTVSYYENGKRESNKDMLTEIAKHFKKAYTFHRAFYDELRKISMDSIDHIDVCFDEYLEAYEDEKIKPEAAARDPKARQIIDNPNPDFEKDTQVAAAGLENPEMTELMDEMKTTVKLYKLI